jgi:O-antigen/teichoic acid export membrane protein
MLFKDSLIYVLSKLVPSGFGFATGIVLSWMLTPEDYGLYGYGMAVAMMVSNVGFDWLGSSFLRFQQKYGDEPRFMPTVTTMFGGLCLAAGAFIGVLAALGISGERLLLLAICTLGACGYAYFELAGRVAIARFRSMRYFWMNLGRNFGILALGAAAAYASKAPALVLAGGFAAMLLAGLAGWRAPVAPRRFDRPMAQKLLRFGMPMMLTMTLYAILTNLNRLMLEGMAGPEEVGFFTAASIIAGNTLSLLASGVGTAAYSSSVRLLERGDQDALRAQLERSFLMLVGLLLPATVGLSMLAQPIAQLCFSPAYEAQVQAILPWLALGTAIGAFRSNYIDLSFQFSSRTGLLVWSYVFPAIASIALNLVLIPRWGGLGAAIATTAAAVIGMVAGTVLLRHSHPLPLPWRELAKVVAATGLMALALWPFLTAPMNPLLLLAAVLAGIAAFAAGLAGFDVLGCRALIHRRLAG